MEVTELGHEPRMFYFKVVLSLLHSDVRRKATRGGSAGSRHISGAKWAVLGLHAPLSQAGWQPLGGQEGHKGSGGARRANLAHLSSFSLSCPVPALHASGFPHLCAVCVGALPASRRHSGSCEVGLGADGSRQLLLSLDLGFVIDHLCRGLNQQLLNLAALPLGGSLKKQNPRPL